MGQYTSYWLYQKYEIRGSQAPIPAYPNVYSIDGDGTMPKVVKTENDTACGYVPTGTTQYRWVNLDPSVDYYCDECPTPQYRWTNSGTTCVGYDKYQRAIKQVSYDNGQTWENVSPAEYSATTLIQADSPDCGYVEPIYRWIKSDDTICVEATAQYRTISGTPYCTGYDKYVDVYSQVSYDSGSTWTTTATTPTLVEADSEDCGYVPPTPPTPPVSCTVITYTANTKLNETTQSSRMNALHTNQFSGSSGQQLTMTSHTFENGVGRIEFDNDIVTVGTNAFLGCTGITSINLPNCITTIGDYVFEDCRGLTSITIPDGVIKIGSTIFKGCSGLTSVNLPNSLTNLGGGITSIAGEAFANCSNLTGITIPNSVTSIPASTFWNCINLTSCAIGTGVTSIGNSAFYGCSTLTTISIPDNVVSIDGSAFYNCSGLTSVTCLTPTPPTLASGVFYNTNNCPIYVPASSVSAYKSATNWSTYADRIQPIS